MVYIILGTGFEEMEAVAPWDILRRGGVEVQFAGIGGMDIFGGHGLKVGAELTVEQIDFDAMDMIVLPGGMGGVRSMLASEATLDLVRKAWEQGKYVAAICAAPTVLAKLGITDGKKAVCYPGLEADMGNAEMVSEAVVRDGRLITGKGPGAAVDFGLALLETLKDRQTAEAVRSGMVYEH